MPTERLRRHAAVIGIALTFAAVSVLNLRDYGLTFDETESYQAGGLYLNIVKTAVAGKPTPSWYMHQLPGYYFVVDILRSGFTRVLSRELRLMDWVLAFHLFHILLSTLAVFLMYGLAYEVSGVRRIATLSALCLALLPQFVAHSQNNPKDLPGLLVIVLATFTFTRLQSTSPPRQVWSAGMALGLALTTHVGAVLLLPVFGIWHVVSGRRLRFKSYVLFAAVATATAFLCWPWLWSAPLDRVASALQHVRRRFGFADLPVLYLGSIYQAWELPWHYLLVSLLACTPVVYLALIVCSIFRLRSGPERSSTQNPRATAVLGWSWCAILVAAETRAPMQYDGARHLLVVVPGMCLLAAVGFDLILDWIERIIPIARSGPLRLGVEPACIALAFASVAAQLIRVHPYQNAYLNEITNAWITGHAEDVFEVEYWAQSYKEGAEWVERHAEPDAAIYIGFADEVAVHSFKRRYEYFDEQQFDDPTHPAYLMLMTRKAWYTPAMTRVAHGYAPVFEVRRQKGTLLAVYSNRLRNGH
jgi:dolichyl-phosphate-mannose-protein mannosyltransferase